MIENFKLWLLDFDGVLVDSYSCLPRVYRRIAVELGLKNGEIEKFVQVCLEEEEKMEKMEEYDRRKMFNRVLNTMNIQVGDIDIDYLIEMYWQERIKGSFVIWGVLEALNFLRGFTYLTIVCASDFWNNMKRKRIMASGLSKFFRRIIIIGEDVDSYSDAIEYLEEEFNVKREEMILVNDRPSVICKVKPLGIITARVKSHPFLESLFTKKCTPHIEAENFYELVLKLLIFGSLEGKA